MKHQSPLRERFAATLAHQPPDRPPMDLGSTDMTEMVGGLQRLAPALGLMDSGGEVPDERILQALGIDIRGIGGILVPQSALARGLPDGGCIDAWGIGHRRSGEHSERTRPLAGAALADLDRFPWPDADTFPAATYEAIGLQARQVFETTPYVVCARHPCFGVMELACWMCGFDDFLYRLAAEPEFAHRLLEILFAYQAKVMHRYYAAVGPYIHFTTSGDDFGTQTGPFLSPAMFREFIAPYLSKRISIVRQHSDAAFFHHSCGSIHALIPDLIAAGVQILNPIQPRTRDMEPERLKRDFGASLTFYGGVDTQHLLPGASAAEVYEQTRALIRVLGAGGGYVLSAAHVLQEEVPVENILALFRAGRESA